ncbi:MAG TPA: hypothetical protein VFJ24_07150 [Gaiellales bacterium]|nr:hypothetical protein [Gaiellales bacterium]
MTVPPSTRVRWGMDQGQIDEVRPEEQPEAPEPAPQDAAPDDDIEQADPDDAVVPPTPEALLAVTGLAVLEEKPRPIAGYQVDEAARLPRRISRELRRFVGRAGFERGGPAVAAFEYMDVLERLSLAANDLRPRVERLLSGIDDPDLALGYSQVQGAALDYLRSVIPRRTRETMAGEKPDYPSKQEVSRFRRCWTVTNDPMVVLHDLNHGCLCPDMVETLAKVYPQTYALMKSLLLEAVVAVKARRPSWTPDHRKDHMLQVLMMSTTYDPAQIASLQENFKKPIATAKVPQQASGGKATSDLATPVQKIEGK